MNNNTGQEETLKVYICLFFFKVKSTFFDFAEFGILHLFLLLFKLHLS